MRHILKILPFDNSLRHKTFFRGTVQPTTRQTGSRQHGFVAISADVSH